MTSEGDWSGVSGPRAFAVEDASRLAGAITEAAAWFGDAEAGALDDVVDPAMLEAVYDHDPGDPSLSFAYAGCVVTVEPGRFEIEPAPAARRPSVGVVTE